MSRPGIMALSGEAKRFVFSNMDSFKRHLVFLFPLILVMEAINQAGYIMHMPKVALITFIPTLILYGLFSLAWFRTSLMGPDSVRDFSFTRIGMDGVKFIILFFALCGLFFALVFGLQMGMAKTVSMNPAISSLALRGGGMIAAMIVLIIMVRLSFFLPSRALGASLSVKDVNRAAKGMTLPLVGSVLIFLVLLLVIMTSYAFIVGGVISGVSGDVEPEGIRAAILGLILSVPIYVAVLLCAALCITALSDAYRWGMENNPH